MSCVCGSTRFMYVSAKCKDSCHISLDGDTINNYPPSNINIGNCGYLEFEVCANCGKIKGKWPLEKHTLLHDE
jgi:hypothetical protein